MPLKRSKTSTATPDKQNEEAVYNNSNVNHSGPSNSSEIPAMRKQRSWYSGTWPRAYKSEPSTEVARESILAAKPAPASGSSSDLSKFESKNAESNTPTVAISRPPSMNIGKSKETSCLTILEGGKTADKSKSSSRTDSNLSEKTKDSQQIAVGASSQEIPKQASTEQSTSSYLFSYIPAIGIWGSSRQSQDQPIPDDSRNREENAVTHPSVQSSTIGPSGEEKESKDSDESTSSWWPWSATSAGAKTSSQPPATLIEEAAPIPSSEELPQSSPTVRNSNRPQTSGGSRRWFSGFSIASGDSVEPKETQPVLNSVGRTTINPSETPEEEGVPTFKDGTQPASGSSWAFFGNWNSQSGYQENGRLAVMGDKSQNNPEPATIENTRNQRPQTPETRPTRTSWRTPDPHFPTSQPHHLLPELSETYKLMEDPSVIRLMTRLVLPSRQAPAEHVTLVKDPPRITKAVAIGVHGMLPPGLLGMLGPATGTSKLFSAHAAAAIHRWTKVRGYDCKVQTVLLEFSGKIEERVGTLFGALLNQISKIQDADLIVFACHSQGVPVSIMLAAKLVDLGILPRSTRIGICAMAGVNIGPFLNLKNILVKTTMSNSIGFELFDFADSESVISKAYVESLRKIIRFGARVTYVGSIDDPLVSMESSTFTPGHHPHIFRAVFADGRLHKQDFIIKLVAFVLKLRNMGVRDHGLIRELSVALAGPLLTSLGHSVVYDHPKVYDLAIQHTLETTSVEGIELKVNPYNTHLQHDPYFLPFAMRGVLEEQLVQTELSNEARDLLQQFESWQPNNSQLVDVKNRLRAIRSML